MTPRHITVGNITIGNDLPLVFIVGPNTLESRGARARNECGAWPSSPAKLKFR